MYQFRTVYVKDELKIEQHKVLNDSVQVVQGFNLQQNDLKKQRCDAVAEDSFFVDDRGYFKNLIYSVNQQLFFSDDFNASFSVTILQQFDFVQKTYFSSIASKQSNIDSFVFTQSWCQSDYLGQDNLIKYTINSNIIVNDIVYSTLNVGLYTFDIFDKFNFFVETNCEDIQLYSIRQKFMIKNKVDTNNLLQFAKIQTENQMYEKVALKGNKYWLFDSLQGTIVSNNITLLQGKHNFTIRKLNTPKAYCFSVDVINPYKRIGDDLFYINEDSRENAKLLSNYQFVSEKINILSKDDIIIS